MRNRHQINPDRAQPVGILDTPVVEIPNYAMAAAVSGRYAVCARQLVRRFADAPDT